MRLLVLLLTYIGFISLGLPDGMLGVAWPSMRRQFGLPLDAISLVLFVLTFGYLISSFSSGRILARINVGLLLAFSAMATGLSLLGYAAAGVWMVIVGLAFVAGLGAGAIDAGLNTYAAIHYSPRTVIWLHACFGLGAAAGPLVVTTFLARNAPWQAGYLTVGAAQLVLAAAFFASRRWWLTTDAKPDPASEVAAQPSATLLSSLRLPNIWFGIATFFVYTGLESAVGTWTFTLLTDQHGLSISTAGKWTGAFWGCLAGGRVAAGFVAAAVKPQTLLRASALVILLGAGLVASRTGLTTAILGILMVGFGCAPIFPSLIALTPARVRAGHAANAVGFQVAAATLGQSLLPSAVGFLAQNFGLPAMGNAWLVAALVLFVMVWVVSTTRPSALDSSAS